jgi:hypothetical protein
MTVNLSRTKAVRWSMMTQSELIKECERLTKIIEAEFKTAAEQPKPILTGEQAYAICHEGQRARIVGTPAKYPPHSVENILYLTGWVQEDLRQALMQVNPVYRAGQERFEAYGYHPTLKEKSPGFYESMFKAETGL